MQPCGKVVFLSESKFTNETLVKGLVVGDVCAAAELHRRFSVRISRWVWRLLGADKEHDDLVQQIFINILSSIRSLSKVSSLESWIDSVTLRTVRYELRKRKLRRLVFSCPPVNWEEDVKDDRNPFRHSHIQSFYTILDEMPASERIILVLRYLEGYSLEQVALASGYSHSTVKRRLKKAKERFLKKASRDMGLLSLIEGCHV
jgi:RNA polymerase sigma-70 factor, ECF subfamily